MKPNSAEALPSSSLEKEPAHQQCRSDWTEVGWDYFTRLLVVVAGAIVAWVGAYIIAFLAGWIKMRDC